MKRALFVILISIFLFSCSDSKRPYFVNKTYSCFAYTFPSILGQPAVDMYYNIRFISENSAERFDTEKMPNGSILGGIDTVDCKISYPSITIYDEVTKGNTTGEFIDNESIRLNYDTYTIQ